MHGRSINECRSNDCLSYECRSNETTPINLDFRAYLMTLGILWIISVRKIFSGWTWYSVNLGTYKVRNEIETKRHETKQNETNWTNTKRNETKRNERIKPKRNKTKPTIAKRNQRKQNENGRKNLKEIQPMFTITMLDYFPRCATHVCLSSWEDRIWSPLNKNTMRLFSRSLSFWLGGFF